jgi:hypothetical protein
MWPQIRQARLPRVQHTAREVVRGLQFLGYAEERTLAYATLFAEILLAHLQRCGVSLLLMTTEKCTTVITQK